MPTHPNGYSRSYGVSTPSGMLGRQTPWKPSQPPMKSHRSSLALQFRRKRILGSAPSKSWMLTSSASNMISPPAARRAAIRSLVTSVWP